MYYKKDARLLLYGLMHISNSRREREREREREKERGRETVDSIVWHMFFVSVLVYVLPYCKISWSVVECADFLVVTSVCTLVICSVGFRM